MATPRTRRRGGQAVKVVVTGPFAAGKTTLIRTISEITVLSTERGITDSTRKRKAETTVAMDFGRIALPGDLWLYLFGTPGQDRFHFMWDDLVTGAIGAVVLVDTERLESCFDAVDYFEARQIPFVLAVNCFDGVAKHSIEDVRSALAVRDETPVFYTDARNRQATKQALITLVTLAMSRMQS